MKQWYSLLIIFSEFYQKQNVEAWISVSDFVEKGELSHFLILSRSLFEIRDDFSFSWKKRILPKVLSIKIDLLSEDEHIKIHLFKLRERK